VNSERGKVLRNSEKQKYQLCGKRKLKKIPNEKNAGCGAHFRKTSNHVWSHFGEKGRWMSRGVLTCRGEAGYVVRNTIEIHPKFFGGGKHSSSRED